MRRPVKRRTKTQSEADGEPGLSQVSMQEAADQILAKLDFHFHCEKDPDSSISPSECTELLKALNEMQKKLTVLQQDARVLQEKCQRRAEKVRAVDFDPTTPDANAIGGQLYRTRAIC
eukprot:symbB.v1.2.016340.t1/scaffold1222.1/size194531/14